MKWERIETAPRGRKVIAAYKNELGNWRRIIARYYLPGTLEAGEDDETADENGYALEGWFEVTETHDFLMRCSPTHWHALPEINDIILSVTELKNIHAVDELKDGGRY